MLKRIFIFLVIPVSVVANQRQSIAEKKAQIVREQAVYDELMAKRTAALAKACAKVDVKADDKDITVADITPSIDELTHEVIEVYKSKVVGFAQKNEFLANLMIWSMHDAASDLVPKIAILNNSLLQKLSSDSWDGRRVVKDSELFSKWAQTQNPYRHARMHYVTGMADVRGLLRDRLEQASKMNRTFMHSWCLARLQEYVSDDIQKMSER